MRRKLAAGLLVFWMMGLAGCAASLPGLQKKFTRKKKEPEHKVSQVYLDQGPYEKQFSNEYYYKTHYTFWRTWQDDMIANLSGNSKKLKRASEEAYSNLDQMARYLKPEKKAQLMPLVEQLDSFRKKFSQGDYSKSSANSMRSELEKVKRLVANDFYYDKVKGDILPETVDLGDAQA